MKNKDFHKLSSENSSNGSKFRLRVPENKTGSWGIIEMCLLKVSNATDSVSNPSISIIPSISANLNIADIREDFPAPVRPTIPI